jgi:hypothetical protein
VGPLIRRFAAALVDLAAASLLGFAAAVTPVGTFFATRAVVMLHIGEPGTLWRGPIPLLMGIAGTFVYSLPCAMLMVALIEASAGRSPGQALLRIPVIPGTQPGSAGERWRRVLIGAAPWWGLTAALLLGSWQLALLAVIALPILPFRRESRARANPAPPPLSPR